MARPIGATDKDGVDVVDHPVGVMDLIATMTKIDGNQPRDPIHDPARPADQDRRRRQADQRAYRLTQSVPNTNARKGMRLNGAGALF